jgi:iron-sulfur cluster insertion protein
MSDFAIHVTPQAASRIAHVLAKEEAAAMFRIEVKGGGCSGFSYHFTVDSHIKDADICYETEGARLVIDPSSLDILRGAELTFIEELGSAEFTLKIPNASARCGCGTSFNIG